MILQCGSLYPLPISKVNLNSLKTYLQNFNYILGFSDHTLDDVAAITSIGLGARVFEKHITLDKKVRVLTIFTQWNQSNLKITLQELGKLIYL